MAEIGKNVFKGVFERTVRTGQQIGMFVMEVIDGQKYLDRILDEHLKEKSFERELEFDLLSKFSPKGTVQSTIQRTDIEQAAVIDLRDSVLAEAKTAEELEKQWSQLFAENK